VGSIAEKWQRFSWLTGFERVAVLEAFVGLAVTWPGLWLAGFRRWSAVLKWLSPHNLVQDRSSATSTSLESARIVARMEAIAARNLLFRPSCLERSLVLWWLLRRRGIPAELRIGARKDAQKLEAHAWVECCGTIVNQPDGTHLHFTPFDGPIASGETH
jgi:Transglutaminase-like superfamily